MIGSIAGDIIGAPYEFNNIKTVDFDIFNKQTSFTDDTVMLLANAIFQNHAGTLWKRLSRNVKL
jgi:ADP-ribosylglycohydrolase